ncbi:hypothetical protein GQ43DRAFT_145818 [Delitschia confertaspora ATCC 74209]|uniref:Uncharacterized protein n=1 Tax=Delitschia confertaspora ATCC 74209 TaxID=1513339 RepID=A0A9P4JG17_9PLEO|nr:hypothetical protein GQ43DRAFT_145818 [Delitschia confertaspora ATCC 74209]
MASDKNSHLRARFHPSRSGAALPLASTYAPSGRHLVDPILARPIGSLPPVLARFQSQIGTSSDGYLHNHTKVSPCLSLPNKLPPERLEFGYGVDDISLQHHNSDMDRLKTKYWTSRDHESRRALRDGFSPSSISPTYLARFEDDYEFVPIESTPSLVSSQASSGPQSAISATIYARRGVRWVNDKAEENFSPESSSPIGDYVQLLSSSTEAQSLRSFRALSTKPSTRPNPIVSFFEEKCEDNRSRKERVPIFLSYKENVSGHMKYMTLRVALIRCANLSTADPCKALRVAEHHCVPMARELQHPPLEGRCWYWVGRAEAERQNWTVARKAFEKAIYLGVEWCIIRPKHVGKDVRMWLRLMKLQERRLKKGRIGAIRIKSGNREDKASLAAEKMAGEFSPAVLSPRWASLVLQEEFRKFQYEYKRGTGYLAPRPAIASDQRTDYLGALGRLAQADGGEQRTDRNESAQSRPERMIDLWDDESSSPNSNPMSIRSDSTSVRSESDQLNIEEIRKELEAFGELPDSPLPWKDAYRSTSPEGSLASEDKSEPDGGSAEQKNASPKSPSTLPFLTPGIGSKAASASEHPHSGRASPSKEKYPEIPELMQNAHPTGWGDSNSDGENSLYADYPHLPSDDPTSRSCRSESISGSSDFAVFSSLGISPSTNGRRDGSNRPQKSSFTERRNIDIKSIDPSLGKTAPRQFSLLDINDAPEDEDLTDIENEEDLTDIEDEGDLTDIEDEGDLSDIEDEGDLSNIENKADLTDIENEEDLTDIEDEGDLPYMEDGGDLSDIENKADLTDIENEGDLTNIEDEGDLSDIEDDRDLPDIEDEGERADIEDEQDLVDVEDERDWRSEPEYDPERRPKSLSVRAQSFGEEAMLSKAEDCLGSRLKVPLRSYTFAGGHWKSEGEDDQEAQTKRTLLPMHPSPVRKSTLIPAEKVSYRDYFEKLSIAQLRNLMGTSKKYRGDLAKEHLRLLVATQKVKVKQGWTFDDQPRRIGKLTNEDYNFCLKDLANLNMLLYTMNMDTGSGDWKTKMARVLAGLENARPPSLSRKTTEPPSPPNPKRKWTERPIPTKLNRRATGQPRSLEEGCRKVPIRGGFRRISTRPTPSSSGNLATSKGDLGGKDTERPDSNGNSSEVSGGVLNLGTDRASGLEATLMQRLGHRRISNSY